MNTSSTYCLFVLFCRCTTNIPGEYVYVCVAVVFRRRHVVVTIRSHLTKRFDLSNTRSAAVAVTQLCCTPTQPLIGCTDRAQQSRSPDFYEPYHLCLHGGVTGNECLQDVAFSPRLKHTLSPKDNPHLHFALFNYALYA